MTNKHTIAEMKQLLGLPKDVHALNDQGHRLIGSHTAVQHFKKIRNDALLEAVAAVAELRNNEEPGPLFKALNEAMGAIEEIRCRG